MGNFLLQGEDIESIFNSLDYCVNPEAEVSVWGRHELHTIFTKSIDNLFPHLHKPIQKKVECTTSCDINTFDELHNKIKINKGSNGLVKSPNSLVQNKENSNTNKLTRKRVRKSRTRVFHPSTIGKALENLSARCESSGIVESSNECTLSDSDCSLQADSFNESSPNFNLSKSIIKKCKKEGQTLTRENCKRKCKIKRNSSCHRTVCGLGDSDSVELNENLSFKASPHLQNTVKGNTFIKSHSLPSDKNDASLLPGGLRDSTILSGNQEITLRRSKRSTWLKEFKLFLKARQNMSGEETTIQYDSSSDDE